MPLRNLEGTAPADGSTGTAVCCAVPIARCRHRAGYPSPYYPGLLQRWDGPGWRPLPKRWWHHEHRCFRAPDRPFL